MRGAGRTGATKTAALAAFAAAMAGRQGWRWLLGLLHRRWPRRWAQRPRRLLLLLPLGRRVVPLPLPLPLLLLLLLLPLLLPLLETPLVLGLLRNRGIHVVRLVRELLWYGS